MKYEIKIGGMSCAHCRARVENALNGISGVRACVSLEEKKATVECDEKTDSDKLREVIEDLGFDVPDIKSL